MKLKYFDDNGNQRIPLPGDTIQRDPEVEIELKQVEDKAKSKVKIVADFLEIARYYNDLVDTADRLSARPYAHISTSKNGRKWSSALHACSEFKPKYNKAEKSVIEAVRQSVESVIPDFKITDKTTVGYFLKEINDHTFLILHTGSDMVVVRDDGVIFPEFSKVLKNSDERKAAWNEFKKNSSQQTESDKATIKESGSNSQIFVAGCRKGLVDGMPSNFQLHAFKIQEQFEAFVNSLKLAIGNQKTVFDELQKTGEGRFQTDEFFFVAKLESCSSFYIK